MSFVADIGMRVSMSAIRPGGKEKWDPFKDLQDLRTLAGGKRMGRDVRGFGGPLPWL